MTAWTPLPEWLERLRANGYGLTVFDGRPRLVGPGDLDEESVHLLTRYAHALRVAAAGTHPAWWAAVSTGRTDGVSGEQLPTVVDGTSDDDLAFACVTCGHPADHLGADLLAFCDRHLA